MTVTWTGFGKPESIKDHNKTITFGYDANRMRFVRDESKQRIDYLTPARDGGLHYERIKNKETGVITHRHYINAGSKSVAIKTTRTNGANKTHYLIRDHIGSIIASIDASTGKAAEVFSYTPWGERREVKNSYLALMSYPTDASTTIHGFTGHEQLPIGESGLVHMNGRIYHPGIGRFLSMDPFVFQPEDTQGWNRYAYVHNNPLSAIDPSGYRSVMPKRPSAFRRFLSFAIQIGLAVHTAGTSLTTMTAFKIFAGTFVAARVGGADTSGALKSATFAVAAAGAAHAIGGHGSFKGIGAEGDTLRAFAHGASQGALGYLESGSKNARAAFVGGFISGKIGRAGQSKHRGIAISVLSAQCSAPALPLRFLAVILGGRC